YFGPAGTFTESAAQKHFGSAPCFTPFASIDDVFRAVEAGNADYGVVPVENSSEGAVSRSLDLLLTSPLMICGEVMLRIHQNLLSRAGSVDSVKRLYSHAQSLAQCHEWLNRNLANLPRVPVASNAEAARMAAEAASGGAAAVLIRALSSGFESAAAPAALAAAAVMGSYYCGVRGLEYCCVSGGFTERACGLYGVAAAAAGMLSVSGYLLSLGIFGAISGGAGIINSVTHQEEAVQLNTASLSASGRTALAAAGGYAGAAAILAAVLLFSAYMLRTSTLTGLPFEIVNFAGAEGFSGGLLGAMLVFVFCAFCLRAGAVPWGGGADATPPELSRSVLKRLAIPAALAMAVPGAAALSFRSSGMGPDVLSAMLISAVMSGALMSAFIRNTAAALENPPVFAEAGGPGDPDEGPDKREYRPAVIALQGTAAPALSVLIKFLPAMALALAELFV
ncbi:MAG: sodium/proton-translocating pyrophosphatase, partial [Elusimicrobiota bacterium]